MISMRCCGIVVGLALLGADSVAAMKLVAPEFLVNTYTSGDQEDPAVCRDENGNFVIVWEDDGGLDGEEGGIFGQRYDSGASPIGAQFQVNSYTTNDQSDPEISCAPNGSFVVVWESDEQDGDFEGVFGQRFGSNQRPDAGKLSCEPCA